MANKKLSQLPELTDLNNGDWLISSLGASPDGLSKISFENLNDSLGASLLSPTIFTNADSPYQSENNEQIIAILTEDDKYINLPDSPQQGYMVSIANIGDNELLLGETDFLYESTQTTLTLSSNQNNFTHFIYKDGVTGWIAVPGTYVTDLSFDEHYALTKLLLRFEGPDQSTTFTDDSALGVNVTRTGDTKIVTSEFKFGTSGCYCINGRLNVPHHVDFNFTSDSTLEGFFKGSVIGSMTVIHKYSTSSTGWRLRILQSGNDWSLAFDYKDTSSVFRTVSGTPTPFIPNQWHYFKIVRTGNVIQLRQDDVITPDVALINLVSTHTQSMYINDYVRFTGSTMVEYLDSIRFTKYARDINEYPVKDFPTH